jgi:hypothetical protein
MVDNDRLSQALSLMENALQLIDEAKADPQLGAHLDLAICRLKDQLEPVRAVNSGASSARPR